MSNNPLSDKSLFLIRAEALDSLVSKFSIRTVRLLSQIVDATRGGMFDLQTRVCLRHAATRLFPGEDPSTLQTIFKCSASSWPEVSKLPGWAEVEQDLLAVASLVRDDLFPQPSQILRALTECSLSHYAKQIEPIVRDAGAGHIKSMAVLSYLATVLERDVPAVAHPAKELHKKLCQLLGVDAGTALSTFVDPRELLMTEPRYAAAAQLAATCSPQVAACKKGEVNDPLADSKSFNGYGPAQDPVALEFRLTLAPELAEDCLGIFGATEVEVICTTAVPNYVTPTRDFEVDRCRHLLAVLKANGAAGAQGLLADLGFTEVKVVATFLTETQPEEVEEDV